MTSAIATFPPPAPRSETEDGKFHQSWYALALASELKPGAVIGKEFLGTRVVLYRDGAGKPAVQSAFCPHLGADLAIGQVINGKIRCAYHHWSFDNSGRCVHIPAGDRIPPGATLATYPSAEAFGLIWAFNGETALFDVPRIPGASEAELDCRAFVTGARNVEPWIATSNGVDFQHLRALHNLPMDAPEKIDVGPYAIEYRLENGWYMQHGLITGVNVFAQHLRMGGDDVFMLFTNTAVARGKSLAYAVAAVRKSAEPPAAVEARLQSVKATVERLFAEDAPVLNTIRFRQGVLVASDRHLARFFKYVREFPRAAPRE